MNNWRVFFIVVVPSMLCGCPSELPGATTSPPAPLAVCGSDKDCKGDRVCNDGKCQDRPSPITSSSPPPIALPVGSTSPPAPPTGPINFEFSRPPGGGPCDHACSLAGSYKSRDSGRLYRPVVVPLSVGNFHPQPAFVQFPNGSNNGWTGSAYLGTPGGSIGDRFDIYIVSSTSKVDQDFVDYLQRGPSCGWCGMSSLPADARIEGVVRRVVRR